MEIQKTQSNLNELTKIFNENFHHIQKDEEMLRQKLNQLITNENKLNRQETVLHNKLQILQITSNKHNSKVEFEQIRGHQLESLTKMIQDSVLRQPKPKCYRNRNYVTTPFRTKP